MNRSYGGFSMQHADPRIRLRLSVHNGSTFTRAQVEEFPGQPIVDSVVEEIAAMHAAVIQIQRMWRGFLARKKYKSLLAAGKSVEVRSTVPSFGLPLLCMTCGVPFRSLADVSCGQCKAVRQVYNCVPANVHPQRGALALHMLASPPHFVPDSESLPVEPKAPASKEPTLPPWSLRYR